MKSCLLCLNLVDGVCHAFKKAPPSNTFAEKCRYYAQDEDKVVEPDGNCERCHRYDRDDTGEWCLFAEDDNWTTFKKLPMETECPLKNR